MYPQNNPKISPRYPPDIPKISPRYAQYILNISPRYPQDFCHGYPWRNFCHMEKFLSKHDRCGEISTDIPKISPSYFLDIPNISPVYPKISPRYPQKCLQNIPNISPTPPHNQNPMTSQWPPMTSHRPPITSHWPARNCQDHLEELGTLKSKWRDGWDLWTNWILQHC